jgi:hypothetical protein
MCALLAASHPLPPAARPAFLEACAKEIANLPELGDGALHRTIVRVQRMYFAPPNVDGRMRRASASGSGETVGTLVLKKPLLPNVSRRCLLGTLRGKKR